MKQLFQIGLLLFLAQFTHAQTANIVGLVTDANTENAVDFATVYIDGTSVATETDERGDYKLLVKANIPLTIVFSRIGYKEARLDLDPLQEGELRNVNVKLASLSSGLEVEVSASRIEDAGIIREEVENLKLIPSGSGNFESILPHIALGTSAGTGGELSSQYNVRGGNYDENLVYVNDFEIYRPQLIRSGQQEGLSFPNIDLIRDLSFSSGGFQSKYGDKMSSVLDIRYKRPDTLKASIGASLLGASAHVEGSFKTNKNSYQRFRYLIGARYKTNRYLLGSLDVTGEYTPNFVDLQGYFTYDITRDLQVGVLTNYNRSEYDFIPVSRSTGLGLIDFALELRSAFSGAEKDQFTTGMGGVSFTYIPDRMKNPFFLKLLGSRYLSDENEQFDIIGEYRLSQIEVDLGSENAGQEIAVLGSGIQQEYVRNYLDATVTNIEHKGGYELQGGDLVTETSHFFQWGLKYQQEEIFDEINEWERLDSAGYSLEFDPERVLLNSVLKSKNELSSNRFTGYLQDTYTFKRDSAAQIKLTVGARAAYWDLNEEFLFSPRMQLLYKPFKTSNEITYKLAAGMYQQAPFYREMRRPDGTVNTNLKSQKSLHIVGGMTWDFKLFKNNPKDFRLVTEVYYKKLWDLVSYDIDNVRIRYSGENDAEGYIFGIDLRLNGEFVPGAESWINLSILQAKERLVGIQHLKRELGEAEAQEVNYVPRPTDRLFNLNMFFQDYLPRNENFKVHLNLSFGSGLPYGLKGNNRIYRNTYRFRAYQRVDIGFSAQLWDRANRNKRPGHFLSFTRSAWLSLEVFNLMKILNVASNTWIKTVFDQQFAVPNRLTSRRINLRLKMDF